MHYEGNIIRPPSEANAIILQVTVGCSHNRCTFCGAYRDRKFHLKDAEIIGEDLEFARIHCRRQKTVFLADGNVLGIDKDRLVELLVSIKEQLPWVRRVSLYGNSRDILGYSAAELRNLKSLGLGRVYMGLESGHDQTLKRICKGGDAAEMIAAGQRAQQAGIFLSVTCLLGIAGNQDSLRHARATAMVLNQMKPSQTAVLTLMVIPGTPLGKMIAAGMFELPDQRGLFLELRTLVENLELSRGQFQANHASNYFSLSGRLPRDKQNFLDTIDQVLAGTFSLKPEMMRRL